jgi:hypothetical protein
MRALVLVAAFLLMPLHARAQQIDIHAIVKWGQPESEKLLLDLYARYNHHFDGQELYVTIVSCEEEHHDWCLFVKKHGLPGCSLRLAHGSAACEDVRRYPRVLVSDYQLHEVATIDGARIEDVNAIVQRFALYWIRLEPVKARVGQPAKASVVIVPNGSYHLLPAFPWSLTLEPPPGIGAEKVKLTKRDGTFTATEGRFEVLLTGAKAGVYEVPAKLRFAVESADGMTDTPRDVELRFVVQVQ